MSCVKHHLDLPKGCIVYDMKQQEMDEKCLKGTSQEREVNVQKSMSGNRISISVMVYCRKSFMRFRSNDTIKNKIVTFGG